MENKHSGIIIEELYFARVLLHIRGSITKDVGDLKNIQIYIEDVAGCYGRFSPESLTVNEEDRTFSLHYHIASINQNMPLPTGEYYLRLKCGEQVYPAYVTEKLNHTTKDGRLITAAQDIDGLRPLLKEQDNNLSFWHSAQTDYEPHGTEIYNVISKLDLDDESYFLAVTTRFYTREPGIRKTFQNYIFEKKEALRHLLIPLKKQMLINYFNRLQKKRGKTGSKKTILFASQSRSELGGNEEFIYNRMKERGLLDQFHVLMDFKSSIKQRRGIRGSLNFTKKLALSDIILIDDFLPFVYKFDFPDDVTFIQLWHACGAFKAVGFERIGKEGSPWIDTRTHKCYTYMPVSSPHSGRHNAEAFGLPEKVFLPIGVPRTDIFFDQSYQKNMIEKLHSEYPILKQRKKVHLYAPTFRGSNAMDAYFPYEKIDFAAWGKALKERNELLIIKMHPFVKAKAPIPEEYKDYMMDFSSYREINDILFIADTLITDYSSVMYEYSLLRRPMYFFAFDQRAYEYTRDFYEPYEQTVPGYIIKYFPKLLEALAEDDYDYTLIDQFVQKNFTYTDGKSTDRCIDEMIL